MIQAPAGRALGLLTASGQPAACSGDVADVRSLGRPATRDDRHRRSTRECLLAVQAVEAMLADGHAERAAITGERTALLYATAAAYAASNRSFIEGGGGIHFAYTAPAVVPSEVAIEFGVTGPYAIFLGGPPATLRAIWQAAMWLDAGACDRALVLAVELFEECADLYRRARRLTAHPLVESAGCLWLAPGQGHLEFESRRHAARSASRSGAAQELLGCAPLADLERWRKDGGSLPLALSGAWRGELAHLTWRREI